MSSLLPSLQGVGAKRIVLVVAMVLSILLNVIVVGVYMHGDHSSRATAAGARPNATPEVADETTTKLLKAEQRAGHNPRPAGGTPQTSQEADRCAALHHRHQRRHRPAARPNSAPGATHRQQEGRRPPATGLSNT